MTTKNIYVTDDDVELFDEAARYAGSMSAAVAAGLRLYVAQQRKAKEAGQMRQIEVEVHDGPVVTSKRFTGRELLRYELRGELRVKTFRVYQTVKGQLAVHVRDDPDWGRLSSPDERNPVWEDERTWGGGWWETTERSLRVYPDVEALREHLPAELADAVRRALTEPSVDDLDI